MTRTLYRAVAVTLVAVACGAPTVDAQTRTAGANRPPVGDAVPESNSGTALNLSVTVAEAYDRNVVAEFAGVTPSMLQASGFYTMFAPQVDFRLTRSRIRVGMTAGTNLRYYGQLGEFVGTNRYIGAGLITKLTPRTTMSFNQGVTYTPSSLYGLFASAAAPAVGEVVGSAPNYAVSARRSYAFGTTANLTHNFSQRAALSFDADNRFSTFTSSDQTSSELNSYNVGGRFLYSLNGDVRLRLGYVYRRAHYGQVLQHSEHDLDVGIEYSRALSLTRRTTVAFALGPALVDGPVRLADTTSSMSRQYRLVTDMSVTRQIGRTWSAQGVYRRGVGFIEGLPNAVFTNGVTLTTTGFVSRRTDVLASAGYSAGESELTGVLSPSSPFSTVTGGVRIRTAVTSHWAVYGEYMFYYYNFNRLLLLTADTPSGLTRNGVRVGFMLRLPVERR